MSGMLLCIDVACLSHNISASDLTVIFSEQFVISTCSAVDRMGMHVLCKFSSCMPSCRVNLLDAICITCNDGWKFDTHALSSSEANDPCMTKCKPIRAPWMPHTPNIVLATEFEDQPVIIYLLDLDLTLQLQKILGTSLESAKRSFQGAFVSARMLHGTCTFHSEVPIARHSLR